MRHATIINLLKHAAVLPRQGNTLVPINRQRFTTSAVTRQLSTTALHQPKTSEQRTAANPAEPPDATNEPSYIAHFRESTSPHPLRPVVLETEANAKQAKHPVYDLDEISSIEQTHHAVGGLRDRLALAAIKTVRTGFDILSGYRGPGGGMTEKDWVNRCLFLETVAGVPGMVAGMLRHLRSLRLLKRDHGWIHTLLEEAENERMHLLIFMNLKHPGWVFRALVVGAQGVFFNGFFLAYLASPQTCHRFVGYLEEEAVKTYTGLLKDIEDGHLGQWKTKQAPLLAQTYYRLPEDASVYDVIKCVRADEANHRDVNHTFANLDQKKGVSPFSYNHD